MKQFAGFCLCLFCLLISCKDEGEVKDPITIQMEDQEITIFDNPESGQILLDMEAVSNSTESVSFSIIDQSVANAVVIDPVSGEISVNDPSVFDFDLDPQITAEIEAVVEDVNATAIATIFLLNSDTLLIEMSDMQLTIPENPIEGMHLLTMSATTNSTMVPVFSILSQSVPDAAKLDSLTGDLSVNDPTAFDYELNQTLTFEIQVSVEDIKDTAIATILLEDINDNLDTDPFVTKWTVDAADLSIYIPTNPGYTYEFAVDWGDGNIVYEQTENPTHTYEDPGTYTVSVYGDFPAVFFNNDEINSVKIVSLESWGEIEWQSMHKAFYGCREMIYNAVDIPDLSQVTDLSYMFANACKFDGDLLKWDVSEIKDMSFMFAGSGISTNLYRWDVGKVNDMRGMFGGAIKFNRNINDWNVSNVRNMSSMFANTKIFNQPLDKWDVGNVTNMSRMFYNTEKFNKNINNWNVSKVVFMNQMFAYSEVFDQPLNNWNVGSVINMTRMFHGAVAFDQDLNSWDVSKVKDMSSMFESTQKFGGNISNWDVSNVKTMAGMFMGAREFVVDIGNWDVSNVTNMSNMFSWCGFNKDIGNWDVSNVTTMAKMFDHNPAFNRTLNNWDVSNVTNMNYMFGNAHNFNGAIGNWNTSAVTNMEGMFYVARRFAQDISGWDISNLESTFQMFERAHDFNSDITVWDVSNVTNFKWMFRNAISFDHNLGVWDISKAVDMDSMLNGSNLSTDNYDATLVAWSQLVTCPSEIRFGASGLTYCTSGAEARRFLSQEKGWIIGGDTNICD